MKSLVKSFTLCLLGVFSMSAIAETSTLPKFTDYPVKVYIGKVAPLDKHDSTAKMFKTHIKESLSQPKPDFAGKYNITSWGCGTSCVSYVMTDRKTGKLYGFEEIAYKVTEHAPKSCSQLPDGDIRTPSEYVTRPNSLLMVEQQYCKTDEKGNNIFLNNYLLWHEQTKTFTLLNQTFDTVKNQK